MGNQINCVTIVSLIVGIVLSTFAVESEARRGRRVQIDYEDSGAWSFPETAVVFSQMGQSDAIELPFSLKVGSTVFTTMWVDENGFIVLSNDASQQPPLFDPSLPSIGEFPGNIIAPFYADTLTATSVEDECSTSGCDVAYSVLDLASAEEIDGLAIDYLQAVRITWGAFTEEDGVTGSVFDSEGLPSATGDPDVLNKFQLLVINREVSGDAKTVGDFDLRFFYGFADSNSDSGVNWVSANTHIGFRLPPYELDFSKFYSPSRRHENYLGKPSNCERLDPEPDALIDPDQVFPCNYILIRFQDGRPELVSFTSDLEATLLASPEAPSATETFELRSAIENIGPEDERRIQAIFQLPQQSEVVGVSPSTISCVRAGVQATCDIGDLEVGSPIEFSLLVRSTDDGEIQYTVDALGLQYDPRPLTNSATTEVQVSPTADIGIDQCIVSNTSIAVGSSFTATCSVSNRGPQPATDFLLSAMISTNLSLMSSMDCVAVSTGFECPISALASGATATVQATLAAELAGSAVAEIDLRAGPENDSNVANNSGSFSLTVTPEVGPNNNGGGGGGGSLGLLPMVVLAWSICRKIRSHHNSHKTV